MSMSTFVISYAYSVTYVTTKMLLVLKEIIREIGLDPAKLARGSWASYEDAIATWLASRHLERVTLEVYDPRTDDLVNAVGYRSRLLLGWGRLVFLGRYRRDPLRHR